MPVRVQRLLGFLYKLIGVHRYIGVKNTFCQNFADSCELGLKFFLKCKYDLKTFCSSNLNVGRYQNNAEFYADFEAVEKNAKNLLTKKL